MRPQCEVTDQTSSEVMIDKLRSDSQEAAAELDSLLETVNTFDALANVMMNELLYNPETYSESRFDGKAAYAEYVAQLVLRRPVVSDRPALFDADMHEKIRSKIHRAFMGKAFESMAGAGDEKLGELAGKLAWEETLVRGTAYATHAIPFFKNLARPIEGWMLRDLGFQAGDCFDCAEAYADCLTDNFLRLRDSIQARIDAMWACHKAGGCGARPDDLSLSADDREFLNALEGRPRREAFQLLRNRQLVLGFSDMGSTILISAEEMSLKSGVDVRRIASCLDFFAQTFGQEDLPIEPQAFGSLRVKPVIRHDDRYILPSPQLMLPATIPAIEAALNPDSATTRNRDRSLWEDYATHKGSLLESHALQLIESALPGSKAERGLGYQFDGKRFEVDGLVVFEKTLFVVETKAGAFSALARKGSEKRVERELGKLLGDAHSQALRCLSYLQSAPDATFTRADGSQLAMQLAEFRRTILVTVTLESLSSFTTTLHRTAETGLFEEGQLPWAISIFDLQVICEHCHIPGQLVHYLRRRLELNRKTKLNAHDELDWFGAYLANGLLFGAGFEDADMISLGSFTEGFDAWYMHQSGERKKRAQKPTMPIASFWINMAEGMEKTQSSGWSEGVLMILDLSDSARRELEVRARRCARRVNEGKMKMSGQIATFGGGLFSISLHYISTDSAEKLEMVRAHVAGKAGSLFCLSNLSLICDARTGRLLACDVTVPAKIEHIELSAEGSEFLDQGD